MAREVADEELALKLKARRRLIGAVALTTAMAVILPMVLDSEPRQTGDNIDLRIPDKDAAGEFVPQGQAAVQPNPAVVESSPVATPEPVSPPEPVLAEPTPVVEAEKPQAKPEPKPEPKPESKPEPKPEPKPVAKVEPKPEPKPVAKPVVKPEVKPEVKPAASKPAEVTKPVATATYVLQVGAYSNAAIAKELQQKLAKQGFKSYLESSNGKERLRVGPYATRDEAEKVRQKLQAQGMQPDLLEVN